MHDDSSRWPTTLTQGSTSTDTTNSAYYITTSTCQTIGKPSTKRVSHYKNTISIYTVMLSKIVHKTIKKRIISQRITSITGITPITLRSLFWQTTRINNNSITASGLFNLIISTYHSIRIGTTMKSYDQRNRNIFIIMRSYASNKMTSNASHKQRVRKNRGFDLTTTKRTRITHIVKKAVTRPF